MQINWEEQLGSETVRKTQVCSTGNKASHLWLKKPVWSAAARGTPSLTGEFFGETHRVLECTQNHPPRNQHQKGPLCLWIAEEVTESQQRAEQGHCSLLDPSPTESIIMQQQHGLPHPGKHLRLCPLKHTRCTGTKKKCGPNKRTDQSSRKNTTK